LRPEELFDELLLELPDAFALPLRAARREEFELLLLDEFELELLEELELELLLELLDVLELELLDELKLEFDDEFDDEFELELLLELLDEFELELPAEAAWVDRADSTALTTASGGDWPGPEPSVAAAAATIPQAPSPAA
jgi:hypothetical protein